MDTQPALQNSPTTPQLSGDTPKKSKKKIFILGAILLVVFIVVVSLVLNAQKKKPTYNIQDTGTHTTPAAADLKFGQNRAVDACNVMPQSLVDQVYGKQQGWLLIQESDQERDISNNTISNDVGQQDGQIKCYRPFAVGDITLHLMGFRSAETATSNYDAADNPAKQGLSQPISGLQAVGKTEGGTATIVGAHDNYQYTLEYSGDEENPDSQALAKLTTVAKQVVKNMNDHSISTRMSKVPAEQYGGHTLVDPCSLFTAQTYEQTVLAPNNQITDSWGKVASPIADRSYFVLASQPAIMPLNLVQSNCKRQNAAQPQEANKSSSQALKDSLNEFNHTKTNTNVQIDYYPDTASAQHAAEIEIGSSDNQAVAGLGDEAFYGAAGQSNELSQLVVRKGTTVMTILTEVTQGASCHNPSGCPAAQSEYLPLAKALVAKLP